MFCKGLRWQVGDGSKISFWFDNWVFHYPLKDVVVPIPGTFHLRVSECLISGGSWDCLELESFLPPALVSKISYLFVPFHPQPDALV